MRELGADDGIVAKARAANSALEVLELARAAGCPLGDLVAARARVVALGVLEGAPIAVDVMIFDRNGSLAGKSDG
jgi:cobalt-precorrin-5B (C1)-methyltransferase